MSPQELRQSILESDVLVYALGIDLSTRTQAKERVAANALRQIAEGTGGRTETVRGSGGLTRTIGSIAEELRSQYTLGSERCGAGRPLAFDRCRRWRPSTNVRARRGDTSH